MFAFDKMRVNDTVVVGGNQVNNGNTLLLKNIPEGTLIYNVESVPEKFLSLKKKGHGYKTGALPLSHGGVLKESKNT